MDKEKHLEIARSGGRAAHAKGTAHKFTTEEAKAAGRKGGAAAVARGREYMAELGRKGGEARQAKRAAKKAAETAQQAS